MTSPTISKHHLHPCYEEPNLDPAFLRHLFITEEAALPLLQSLLKSVEPENKKSLVVTDLAISPVETPAYQLVPHNKASRYINAFLLVNAKKAAIYIAGTESFIWQVNQLITQSNPHRIRVHLLQPVPGVRRVICTHCFTSMDNVTGMQTSCSCCQRQLEIHEQYSEVHGAYTASGIHVPTESNSPKESLF